MSEADTEQLATVADDDGLEAAADAIGVEPDRVARILDRVDDALADVVEMDIESPEDLDRVRQSLPTDPQVARLLHASFPPALRDALEYVRPSDRQSGYWRRSRERSDPEALSDAELLHRYEFAQTAIEQRGVDGTVPTGDGRRIPRAADRIGDALEDESFEPADADDDADREKGINILERIAEWV